MRTSMRLFVITMSTVFTLLLFSGGVGRLGAKEKSSQVSSDDPTLRLYNLLDSKYNGKLDDFYLLADVVNDPKNPGQPQQHVLRVEYSKDRAFGKLRIYMRTVAQVTPEQLKAYTPKQIYEFAENDSAKFTKTDPGSFGKVGDVYFEPVADGALGTVPISSEVQTQYDHLVTQYLIPALEKKTADGSGL